MPAELFFMALDPLYLAVEDSVPHGFGFDKGECAKLTAAKDTMFKKIGAGTEEMEPRHIWHTCPEE